MGALDISIMPPEYMRHRSSAPAAARRCADIFLGPLTPPLHPEKGALRHDLMPRFHPQPPLTTDTKLHAAMGRYSVNRPACFLFGRHRPVD